MIPLRGPIAALMYGSTSVAIVLFNKAVLSSFDGSFPFALPMCQSLAGMLVFWILGSMNVLPMSPMSFVQLKRMLVVSGINSLNVALSFVCLQYTTVPTYGTLRRLAIICTLIANYFVFRKNPSRETITAVLVMGTGGILMGLGDVSFSMIGYVSGIGSSVLQALFLVLGRKVFDEENLTAIESSRLHCWASFPYNALFFMLTDEPKKFFMREMWADQGFLTCFLMSVLLGVALIFTTQYCIIVNSPLAVTTVGQMKVVLQAVMGILLFGTRHPPMNMLGIVVGFFGSAYYTKIKYDEAVRSGGPIKVSA
eukprot:ANDGO_08138.mRNA.1 Putative UDP-sugar transporter DDB_G0278631